MDKISGIIPSSARTRSADVSNSQPVRPGAPAMGRPEGKVTGPMPQQAPVEDKVTISAVDRVKEAQPGVYKNSAENARLKMIDDMANKFFNGPGKFEHADGEATQAEEVVAALEQAPRPHGRSAAVNGF